MENIQFQEALLTLPPNLNRYDYHRIVSDQHSRGAPPAPRNYIYDIRPLGKQITACTMRSHNLPSMFNPQTFHLSASEGQEVTGSVVLTFVKRRTEKPRSEKHKGKIILSDVKDPETFVHERMANCGLNITSLPQGVSLTKIPVNKGKNIIPVVFGRVNFTANITDLQKLGDTYLSGVGRSKTFGFGMIYLPELVKEGAV